MQVYDIPVVLKRYGEIDGGVVVAVHYQPVWAVSWIEHLGRVVDPRGLID